MPERDVHPGYPGVRVLSTIPPQCPFCYHANPAGAKFCNDCGSPLHLKPCRQCDAINDQAARKCYKCGTEDPTLVTTPDAPLVSLVADSTAASATSSDVGSERGHPVLPEVLAESVDIPSRRSNATTSDCESGVETITHEPRSSGEDVSAVVSETPRTTHVVPSDNVEATAGRQLMSRSVLAGFPPVVLLTAVALSAYYVYLHPLQLREWLSAIKAPATENPGGLPTQSIPGTIGVPASSALPADVDIGGVAAINSAGSAPPNKSSSDATPSPTHQDGTAATGPDSAGGQALAPNQTLSAAIPQPPGPARDQATPARLATQAENVVGAPGTATAIATELRDKTTPAAGRQVAATDAAANRSTATRAATAPVTNVHSPPRDGRAITPQHVTRSGGCTEALGACSSKKALTTAKATPKKPKKTPTKKPASTQAAPAPKASTTITETPKTDPPRE